MSCYFMAQIQIHNQDEYTKYLDLVDQVFEKFNGKYLAVDEKPTVLEGTWNYDRVVLIEFQDETELSRWYNSTEYQTIVKHRINAAHCDTLIIKGLK
ncbi:DUF1330 domain-containing protein [Mobilitalea sibirica]|uniref:DUF1330 domain-containing protein n=1 Tax=Mobilitalea sibirica TaxID=1462919 RepID=A0A8J7KWS0_9FIRM|nr:DUF1330 domain-containing protein [Mobilitalea sibirica]MBH1940827.1 DUF1330 domain-containing protein [Mobilitalea sibirica]